MVAASWHLKKFSYRLDGKRIFTTMHQQIVVAVIRVLRHEGRLLLVRQKRIILGAVPKIASNSTCELFALVLFLLFE